MRVAAIFLLVGCSPHPANAPKVAPVTDDCADFLAPNEDRVALFLVDEDDQGPILQARGALFVPPAPDATFAVVDDLGFVGVVARGDYLGRYRSCYDAPCPSEWRARWTEKPTRAPVGLVTALGPKGERFRNSRRLLPAPTPAEGALTAHDRSVPVPTNWQTEHAYDVDGDGLADVESRVRCCPGRKRPLVWELRERTAPGFRVALRMTATFNDLVTECARDG